MLCNATHLANLLFFANQIFKLARIKQPVGYITGVYGPGLVMLYPVP